MTLTITKLREILEKKKQPESKLSETTGTELPF